IVRFARHQRAVNRLQLLEGTALFHCRAANQVEVLVPAQPKIESQTVVELPGVLEVHAKHLAGDDEGWITSGGRHADHGAGLGETSRSQQGGWLLAEIDLRDGIEFKETTQERFPQIVKAGLERVTSVRKAH